MESVDDFQEQVDEIIRTLREEVLPLLEENKDDLVSLSKANRILRLSSDVLGLTIECEHLRTKDDDDEISTEHVDVSDLEEPNEN